MRSVKNTNQANRNVVQNIKLSVIEDIRRIVEPHFSEGGYVQLDEQHERCGGIDCEGFTDYGVITDDGVIQYSDMSFEQCSFALDVAIDTFGEANV